LGARQPELLDPEARIAALDVRHRLQHGRDPRVGVIGIAADVELHEGSRSTGRDDRRPDVHHRRLPRKLLYERGDSRMEALRSGEA
jgi:hypothetical protein